MSTIDLRAPLDELLGMARERYAVRFEPVTIDTLTLQILQLEDMDGFVDKLLATLKPGMPVELPYWAKIWRTSFLLSYYLMRKDGTGKSLLEIGAGVGLCGLVAAARGFRTTISDISEDALLFSRINILQNGLGDHADVARVDFTADRLPERFDVIVGCEVLYVEDHYRPLSKFLLANLKPEASSEVILAREYTRKATKFYNLAEREFHISTSSIGFRPKDDDASGTKHLAEITRLTPRKHA